MKRTIIITLIIIIVVSLIYIIYSKTSVSNITYYVTGKTYAKIENNKINKINIEGYDYTYRANMYTNNKNYNILLALKMKNERTVEKANIISINKNNNEIKVLKEVSVDIDPHDFVYIDDNHFIIAEYYYEDKIIDGNMKKVKATLIKEIKDDKILWEFKTTDYPEFYNYYDSSTAFYNLENNYDYMHFNSFAIDPNDNNLLASFRNINAIIKINRATGKYIWILGGLGNQFNIPREALFTNQHSISFESDNSILMYDNGTFDKCSRILELKIDETNKKVIDYNYYEFENVHTDSWGSVIEINKKRGIYLIHYGVGGNPDRNTVELRNLKTGEIYSSISFKDGETYQIIKE